MKRWIFAGICLLLCLGLFGVRLRAAQKTVQKTAGETDETGEEAGDAAEATTEAAEIDVDGLAEDIRALGENELPSFSEIFAAVKSLDLETAFRKLGAWLFGKLSGEFTRSRLLVGELLGVILFTALFSNISAAFPGYHAGESSFLLSYFLTFTILFTNFALMAELFKETVALLSNLLKLLIPVYTLSITLSGSLSTGLMSYEYFMVVVLVMNALCVHVILPGIEYYLILEMLNHFSVRANISRLCGAIYACLAKGMKLLFFLFFGFHLLETMLVPVSDQVRNTLLNKVVGLVPGAGTVAQTVTGTVLGSAVLIKNTLGVTAILFILAALAVPLCKLLLYALLHLLLTIVLEPVADERFLKCIGAAQKSGMLLFGALCFSASLFILTIAVTSFATNQM